MFKNQKFIKYNWFINLNLKKKFSKKKLSPFLLTFIIGERDKKLYLNCKYWQFIIPSLKYLIYELKKKKKNIYFCEFNLDLYPLSACFIEKYAIKIYNDIEVNFLNNPNLLIFFNFQNIFSENLFLKKRRIQNIPLIGLINQKFKKINNLTYVIPINKLSHSNLFHILLLFKNIFDKNEV